MLGQFAPNISIYGRYSRAERASESLTQGQLTAEWRINDDITLSGELRRVEEARLTRRRHRHARRACSTSIASAPRSTCTAPPSSRSTTTAAPTPTTMPTRSAPSTCSATCRRVGAEATTGDRGDAALVNAEYRLSPDHSFYGAYTWSTDTTDYDPLFNDGRNAGWTLGQRWRLSNQINVFNESQYLKAPNESGLAHTFGMDFYPGVGLEPRLHPAERASSTTAVGQVDRRAVSVNGGRTSNDTQLAEQGRVARGHRCRTPRPSG